MVQDDQRESSIRSGPRESERPLSAQQAIKAADPVFGERSAKILADLDQTRHRDVGPAAALFLTAFWTFEREFSFGCVD